MEKAQKKILLVEDLLITAEDTRVQLEEYGFEVVGIATRGEDAVKLADEKHPDLILMDINLAGELDGIETARIINSTQSIPIVYATAYGDIEYLDQTMSNPGTYGFLHKPLSPGNTRSTIEVALSRYETDQINLRIKRLLEIKDVLHGKLRGQHDLAQITKEFCDILNTQPCFRKIMVYLKVEDEVHTEVRGFSNQFVDKQVQDLICTYEDRPHGLRVDDSLSEQMDANILSMPLDVDGNILGFLVMESRYDHETTPGEYGILLDIGHLLESVLTNAIGFQRDKLNQQKLFDSEARLSSILEKSTTGVFLIDDEYKFEYVNDRFCEIYGRSKEEIVGHRFTDFSSTAMDTIIERYEARQAGEHPPEEYETDIVRPDGEIRNLITSAAVFRSASGKMETVGHIRDVTTERQITQELGKLSQAVEQSPIMTFITNPRGEVEYVNSTVTQRLGYAISELRGKRFQVLDSGLHTDEFWEVLYKTVRSGNTWNGELVNIPRSGALVWVKATVSPVTDDEDTVQHLIVLEEDITHQREQQRLAERNEHLRSVLYEIATAAMESSNADDLYEKIYDHVSKIISTNNFFLAVLNKFDNRIYFPFERDDLGEPLPESIEYDPKSSLTARIIADGESMHLGSQEIDEMVQQGQLSLAGDAPTLWLGIPLKVEEEVIGALVLQEYHTIGSYDQEDIQMLNAAAGQIALAIDRARKSEALHALAEELSSANSLKELLLDVITHDLKNPAGIIGGAIELLEGVAETADIYDILRGSADNLIKVIENATVLSKISLGESIQLAPMDIVSILKDTITEFHSQLMMANMILTTDLPDSQTIMLNPIISEIPKNFLSNAIRYASEGGKVHMRLQQEGENIVLRVDDCGSPIPADKYEAIFQRSVQLDKNSKKGRGLGLAIVRRIAEAHEAAVGVEPSETGGNSFFIKFNI